MLRCSAVLRLKPLIPGIGTSRIEESAAADLTRVFVTSRIDPSSSTIEINSDRKAFL